LAPTKRTYGGRPVLSRASRVHADAEGPRGAAASSTVESEATATADQVAPRMNRLCSPARAIAQSQTGSTAISVRPANATGRARESKRTEPKNMSIKVDVLLS